MSFTVEDLSDWDKYFIDIAKSVSVKSKDPNTKIGAVIVNQHNAIISTGYNSFVRGLDDYVAERYERPEKYFWIEHAERNAIYNAARMGHSLDGSKMYLWGKLFTCIECAKGIIQSGIKTLVAPAPDLSHPKYSEDFIRATTMYRECGVETVLYQP